MTAPGDTLHALRDAEARWRALFVHSLDGMLLTTPDGRVFAANPAACALFARSEAEICEAGRAGLVVMDEDALRFLAARARDGHASGPVTLRRKDGTSFRAEVSSAIFTDAAGVQHTSMSFRDITDRERARRVLEILADAGGVLVASLDTQTTLSNLTSLVVPKLADVCTVDLVLESVVTRVAVAHRDPARAEDFVRVRRPIAREEAPGGVDRVLQTGEPTFMFEMTEDWLRAAAHDQAHFESSRKLGIRSFVAVPLIARGRTIGALSLMSDGGVPAYSESDVPLVRALAERAALAIDNARQYAEALEARRLRDEVLAVVSHDLNNPLNTINISASLLAKRAPDPDLATIKSAVARASRLIHDLLLVSKADASGIALQRQSESVTAIVEEVASLHRAIARSRSVELLVAAERDPAVAKVDRHRVIQMLSNLVANALKFTAPGGRVELRTRRVSDEIVVSVSDTGPGISAEDLPHVFDRFWQGTHGKGRGVGLGLPIARGIAQAHGGEISVTSEPGKGTTFSVTIPAPLEDASEV